jgi:hypothetical protein
MPRDLPTGFDAAVTAAVIHPAFAVEVDWPGTPLLLWTGYGPLSWASKTFVGVGHLGAVSEVRETRDGRANGLTLQLSGIPSEAVADALANNAQGRAGRVYLIALTASGTLAADPYLIFDGLIDVTALEDTGSESSIQVTLEKELIDRRAQSRRTTHEDQQIDYPGDEIFSFVAGLAERSFNWGGKTVAGTAGTPGAGDSGGFADGGSTETDYR